MNSQDQRKIWTIGSMTVVMIIGNSMFIPVLPHMEQEWSMTSTQAGLTLSIFSFVAAVMIPLVGYLALRFEKKILTSLALLAVIIGCVIALSSLSIHSTSISFLVLMLGRACQGLGAGILSPLPYIFAGELFAKNDQPVALSMVEVFNGIGKVTSPFIGIYAITLGGEWLFVAYIFVSLLSLFLTQRQITRTKDVDPTTSLSSYLTYYRKNIKSNVKGIFHILLMSGMTMLLLFGYLTYFSYELEWMLGKTGIEKALYFTVPLLLMTLSSWWTGKYLKRNTLKSHQLLYISFSIMAGVFILGILLNTFISIVFIMSFFAISAGISLVCCNLLLTRNVLLEDRTTIMSFYSMTRFVGVACGPPLYSLWMYEEALMFSFSLLLLIAVWGYYHINKLATCIHVVTATDG
ncbi:hypothetical protein CR194_01750 [Salipaludibacillus keqinensis]|uniref:Major facilitator superfamily (MFS) profile domain-containing protein n=1 Tax=Salipaludibacillus keqinensis TaxID=2045207 RepID=A0A323TJA9_9BACI|nr:MFS transporter [Salipaludibacillus keqinensis]PYZ94286.1 hypothetical protein CR194_01750 [Salipaludibacillus keqinensis]